VGDARKRQLTQTDHDRQRSAESVVNVVDQQGARRYETGVSETKGREQNELGSRYYWMIVQHRAKSS
jgi:hypothetical protein